ncbi:hypothetical protein N7478_009373 [Penicillium angulare]|uniref:uncharacterized protein n=1 Tax=Penicillium angulare TaxID=116970 RepID=UPI00254250B7|nr:uncharacterized protein N7478_009373 [Penicillium angulare]KAJ5266565.1 hypothetical protein N7478_009373 [Penicillium angulare]
MAMLCVRAATICNNSYPRCQAVKISATSRRALTTCLSFDVIENKRVTELPDSTRPRLELNVTAKSSSLAVPSLQDLNANEERDADSYSLNSFLPPEMKFKPESVIIVDSGIFKSDAMASNTQVELSNGADIVLIIAFMLAEAQIVFNGKAQVSFY